MADDGKPLPLGQARFPGPAWPELAAADSRPMPDFLRNESYQYLGSQPLAAERYTGADFFRKEVEKMWPNVWQYAARDEDMPDPGDTVVYENVGRSYVLCRQQDGSVRAFHNVCLHRGRKLRTENGPAEVLQCPYHGFTWGLDGSMQQLPCKWDFGHLEGKDMSLPEAECDRWGGYIFVRENPGGPSLMEYLDPLPQHFKRWHHERRTTTLYVAKIIRANWKAVMEAFQEQWHAAITHPQIQPFTGDWNGACNIFGDHVNFGIAPNTVSPAMDRTGVTEQWLADYVTNFSSRGRLPNAERVIVPEGKTARAALGDNGRKTFAELWGFDLDHATDCEMLDSLFYSVFPNFGPWGGFRPSIDYRFRPWPDQDRTLMEVRFLSPVPPGQPIPRAAPMKLIDEGVPWITSEEIGESLGIVLDQDVNNVEQVHAGLKCSKTGTLQLANYMDIRIRHFHTTLDKYLAR